MIIRSLLASLLLALLASTSPADTTLIDDDFESYANDDALYAVWEPRDGSGANPPANPFEDDGILTTDDTLFPGIEGQAVDHIAASINQFTGLTPAAPIHPTASQSIHVQGDIFVGNAGNYRNSIALRSRTSVQNLLELGTYNTNTQTSDPTDPDDPTGVIPATAYAFRMVLFGGLGGDLVEAPNWQFFQFDPALDIDDSDPETTEPTPDGIVSIVDIGAAWHTYSATITPDSITVEMDLYRDGLDNGATVTAGSDVPGVDASVTYEVITSAAGFDSFRFGGVSGLSSAGGGAAYDNISLTLVDVVAGGGSDADGDGDVDGADFLKLQRDNPSGIAQWQIDYNSAPVLGLSAVPEPASLALLLLATAGLLASRRS